MDNQNIDMDKLIEQMAIIENFRAHSNQLNIPILSVLEEKVSNDPQTILLASNNRYIEQLVSDGHLEEGDFENRIQQVIESTKEFMRSNNCENVDHSILFYQDYHNGTFQFKIYVQDVVVPTETDKRVVRSMIAFFEEPKMHDFYQLSLSIGPFTDPVEDLKLGVIDLEEDTVTIELEQLMKLILTNLNYKVQ